MSQTVSVPLSAVVTTLVVLALIGFAKVFVSAWPWARRAVHFMDRLEAIEAAASIGAVARPSNYVYAGPAGGSPTNGIPTFRPLVAADVAGDGCLAYLDDFGPNRITTAIAGDEDPSRRSLLEIGLFNPHAGLFEREENRHGAVQPIGLNV